jgi:hypothetical protein
MPFCGECHLLFHEMVKRADIDLSYTHDPVERIRRALAAITIAEWMLLEQLKNVVTQTLRRNAPMKKRNNNNKSKVNLPPPANKHAELTPFLKATDITKKGITEITLLGDMRKSKSRFGEGIELACTVGGKLYTWTIKFESGNYSRLYERFGEEDWKGIVNVERKEYKGREYVAVVD